MREDVELEDVRRGEVLDVSSGARYPDERRETQPGSDSAIREGPGSTSRGRAAGTESAGSRSSAGTPDSGWARPASSAASDSVCLDVDRSRSACLLDLELGLLERRFDRAEELLRTAAVTRSTTEGLTTGSKDPIALALLSSAVFVLLGSATTGLESGGRESLADVCALFERDLENVFSPLFIPETASEMYPCS